MADKRTEIRGIYKTDEGALVNKDNTALQAYRRTKAKDRQVKSMEKRLNNLQEDITLIKNLLQKALDK